MSVIEADIQRVQKLESEIKAGGIIVSQIGFATDTEKWWFRQATDNYLEMGSSSEAPITAQISNPTATEFQALIDSGVTVFYGGVLGGRQGFFIPEGTFQMKDTNYYFHTGSNGAGGYNSYQMSGDVEFVFPSDATTCTVYIEGLGGANHKLTLTTQSFSHNLFIGTLNGYKTLESGYVGIEQLNSNLVFIGNYITYQYKSVGGVITKDTIDITETSQGNWVRNDQSDWNATTGNTEILNKPDLNGVKKILRGWVDQDNVKVIVSTVNGEGIITLSTRIAVDNEYYCNGVKYTLPHSTDIVLNAGDIEGDRWVFMVDGVLTMSDDFIPSQCPARLVGWDSTNKQFIKSIPQAHGTIMDEVVQGYIHLTRGSAVEKAQDAFKLYEFTTGGDGSTDAEYQFKRKDGVYRDEDIEYDIPEYLGSFAPVYYEDYVGGESVSRRYISSGTGVNLFDSYLYNNPVTGMPYYNKLLDEVTGQRGLSDVEDGKYFMMLVFCFGDDDDDLVNRKYEIAVMGQNQYTTLNEARLNASSEIQRTEGNYETLQEIASVGVVIFQADSSFTNNRKCKIVPFSTASEGKFQPYYDMTNISEMETVLQTPVPEAGFDVIGEWGWSQYTATYGYCANDLTTSPNGFTGATTFSINRNKLDGANMATELDLLPTNAELKFVNKTRESQVSIIFNGDFTKAQNIYTATIDTMDLSQIGDGFSPDDVISIQISSANSYFDEKVKATINDTTTGYLADKIIAGDNTVVSTVNKGAGDLGVEIDIAEFTTGLKTSDDDATNLLDDNNLLKVGANKSIKTVTGYTVNYGFSDSALNIYETADGFIHLEGSLLGGNSVVGLGEIITGLPEVLYGTGSISVNYISGSYMSDIYYILTNSGGTSLQIVGIGSNPPSSLNSLSINISYKKA